MPKTTKLGGPSHEVPAEVVATLTPEDIPKGLTISGVDPSDLDEAQQAAVDLGQAKVRFEERGEARIAAEQEELRKLAEDPAQREEPPVAHPNEDTSEALKPAARKSTSKRPG